MYIHVKSQIYKIILMSRYVWNEYDKYIMM
jgi:hypothetical protein